MPCERAGSLWSTERETRQKTIKSNILTMKARYALLAAAALLSQAFAGTPTIIAPALEGQAPKLCSKKVSGSVTAGYATNYTCRGIVASHALAQGDSVEKINVDLSYDVGRKSYFSLENHMGYTVLSSGHKYMGIPGVNIENEFVEAISVKYTRKRWFASVGYQLTHGGLLGADAKFSHNKSHSTLHEGFVTLAITPISWLEAGVKTSYAFSGVNGWWFEPYVKGTWTLVGCKEAPKLQGVVTLAMSATSDFYSSTDINVNGTQAMWVEAAMPWHITKHLVLTPSVSFNWLGCGAHRRSGASDLYRNHGIVAGVNASYVF